MTVDEGLNLSGHDNKVGPVSQMKRGWKLFG